MISETDKQRLNAIPLTDVMLAWGMLPTSPGKGGTSVPYLCPWHDDHRPSLKVDITPKKGCSDLGFYCGTCKQKGFGAIAKSTLEIHAKTTGKRSQAAGALRTGHLGTEGDCAFVVVGKGEGIDTGHNEGPCKDLEV